MNRNSTLRWLVFGFLCLLLIAAASSAIRRYIHLTKQQSIFHWVVDYGGYVEYSRPTPLSNQPFWIPKFFRKHPHFFDDIHAIGIVSGSPPLDRSFLEALPELSALKEIRFELTDLIDDDLMWIGGCRNIEVLSISRSSITDVGITHLVKFEKLRELDLSYCRISGEGILELSALRDLKEVNLAGVHLSKEERAAILSALPDIKVVF